MNREKCEAIILSTLNYKDSDKIFLLFTPDKGIITAMAKGVRKINSKRSTSLDTLNLVKVSIDFKNNYYFIEDTVLIDSFDLIKKSIMFLSFSYFLVEATKNIVPEQVPSIQVYKDLKNALESLNKKPSKRIIYLYLKKLLLDSGLWDYAAEVEFPFLSNVENTVVASLEDQRKIDSFFTSKIEEIGEKKLNSKLLIAHL